MKRTIALTILAALGAMIFAQAPVAVIKQVAGTVEIKAPGKDWVPARAGASLTKDTAISTGFKSVAVVTVGASTLTVKPLTRLTLGEIARLEGSETVRLALLSGRVRADVKPPAGGKTDFTVKSPTATASVRGTGFDQDIVNLDVGEGDVEFTGPDGQPVQVGAGQSSTVDEDGGAVPPEDMPDESLSLPFPAGLDGSIFSFVSGLVNNSGSSWGTVELRFNPWGGAIEFDPETPE